MYYQLVRTKDIKLNDNIVVICNLNASAITGKVIYVGKKGVQIEHKEDGKLVADSMLFDINTFYREYKL